MSSDQVRNTTWSALWHFVDVTEVTPTAWSSILDLNSYKEPTDDENGFRKIIWTWPIENCYCKWQFKLNQIISMPNTVWNNYCNTQTIHFIPNNCRSKICSWPLRLFVAFPLVQNRYTAIALIKLSGHYYLCAKKFIVIRWTHLCRQTTNLNECPFSSNQKMRFHTCMGNKLAMARLWLQTRAEIPINNPPTIKSLLCGEKK